MNIEHELCQNQEIELKPTTITTTEKKKNETDSHKHKERLVKMYGPHAVCSIEFEKKRKRSSTTGPLILISVTMR